MTVIRTKFDHVMNPTGTNVSSITVPVDPDIRFGQIMVAVTTSVVGTTTGTGPDAFELMGTYVTGTQQSNLYRRVATDQEPADYTWTFASASSCGAAIITFGGCHDLIQWDAKLQVSTGTPSGRRMAGVRDSIVYTVCCWLDNVSNTFTTNQGTEEFDRTSANSGGATNRGMMAAIYDAANHNDIINAGDSLPGTTFTASGGNVDRAITWTLQFDNAAPPTESWSEADGDFAVELELDRTAINSLGGISTPMKGDVSGQVVAFAESGENPPSEITENLVDGLNSTKWLVAANSGYVQYDFGAGNEKTIKRYRLTSANDFPGRDPYEWILKGSNNGTDFTDLDPRVGMAFGSRGESQDFKVASPGSYRYYRLDILSNLVPTVEANTQLAEFRLSVHDSWEDITSSVQEEQKIRITRGFQGASGRHDYSRAYVTLDNRDGRFSVKNQDGLYYGSIQRNTQMRISKAFGDKTLQLQGDVQLEGTSMTGDSVRCPLTAALLNSADQDVRIDLHPDSWRQEQMLAGIHTQSSDGPSPVLNSWVFYLTSDGRLTWTHAPDPTVLSLVTYTSTKAVPNVGRQAVRVAVDVDGVGASTATFYIAPTIDGPWERLGDIVEGPDATFVGYRGGSLCVGHVPLRSEGPIHGRVYGFQVLSSIDGDVTAGVDFTGIQNGAHEFHDNDALTGTATGVGTSTTPDYIVVADADASDILVGDKIQLRNADGTLKEDTVFTVTGKPSGFGFTNIEFTPDAQENTVAGDVVQAGVFNRWVTVNNAVVSNRHYRFHGEVSEWPLYWDTTGSWIECAATGAGIQKRLERGSTELSALKRHHTKGIIPDPGAFERFAEPVAYWPFEDKKDTVRVSSGLPGLPHMEIYGNAEFESFGDFPGSDSLPKLNGAKFGGRIGPVTAPDYADIRFVLHVPETIPNNSVIMRIYTSGEMKAWEILYPSTDTWEMSRFDEVGLENNTRTSFAGASVDTIGELIYCQVHIRQDGTKVDYGFTAYDPYGAILGSVAATTADDTTMGRVTRVDVNTSATAGRMVEAYMGHVAVYDTVDAPLATDVLNAHLYEAAGDRIKRICDEEQIEFRSVGAIDQSAMMGFQDIAAPFPLLSTGSVSDDSFLIDPLDAFGIEFKTNRSLYNQAPHVTISYAGNELSGELEPTQDDAHITNDFTASRGSAGSARFRREDGPLSVNPPPDGVGEYSSSQSYSFAHEGQCIQMASWQVHRGTLDEERFPKIELALENLRVDADPALAESILTLDVGRRIDITDVPEFLPAEDIRQIVIGYQEWFDNFQHNFQINTVPERIFEIAEYDSGYHFDTTNTSLTVDINPTATSISAQTLSGPLFTGDPKSYPFDIEIGGEVMRVLAWGTDINTNPLFSTNLTGWIPQFGPTITHETSVLHPDPLCVGVAKVTPDGVDTEDNILNSFGNGLSVSPQRQYTVSGWAMSLDERPAANLFINWHDAGGAYITTSSGPSVTLEDGEWTYMEATFTAPATSAEGDPGMRRVHFPGFVAPYYVWNLKITEEPVFLGADKGDSFNRADSTTVLGSTDRGVVEAWTQVSNTWGIQANQAYVPTSFPSLATLSGEADFEQVSVEVPVFSGAADAFVVFRAVDGNNHWRWGGSAGGGVKLQAVASGVVTDFIPDVGGNSWILAAGDKLSVRCNGSVIECFVNDKLAYVESNSYNQTATIIGMLTTSNITRFDNFYFDSGNTIQILQVERGINQVASAHKRRTAIEMSKTPYRGL